MKIQPEDLDRSPPTPDPRGHRRQTRRKATPVGANRPGIAASRRPPQSSAGKSAPTVPPPALPGRRKRKFAFPCSMKPPGRAPRSMSFRTRRPPQSPAPDSAARQARLRRNAGCALGPIRTRGHLLDQAHHQKAAPPFPRTDRASAEALPRAIQRRVANERERVLSGETDGKPLQDFKRFREDRRAKATPQSASTTCATPARRCPSQAAWPYR